MTRTTVSTQHPAHARAGIFVGADITPAPTPGISESAAAGISSPRHLLGLEGAKPEFILGLLDAADRCRARWRASRAPQRDLEGVEVCNAFFEDSTRTRDSFELGERRLGMTVATFAASGSSISKGESMLDTLHTIVAMGVDIVVVRHPSSGASELIAREIAVSVINAGDGMHEHPTQ